MPARQVVQAGSYPRTENAEDFTRSILSRILSENHYEMSINEAPQRNCIHDREYLIYQTDKRSNNTIRFRKYNNYYPQVYSITPFLPMHIQETLITGLPKNISFNEKTCRPLPLMISQSASKLMNIFQATYFSVFSSVTDFLLERNPKRW
ncbi:MAG: hypothetical protein D8M57_19195 [Candidatus Scalindua sp. AMX11]|nr:MAG: hypothetical protein DWQ00_03115 [Candidatus Scalindua sp.]TDE63257.1 MAG: hypothetical protein D8M57_19195 [Candidatus Scalindua sp. AMX11]